MGCTINYSVKGIAILILPHPAFKCTPSSDFLKAIENASKDLLLLLTGTYSLFTIPGEKEWEVIVSSDLNNWGSSGYKKENTVASIKAPGTMSDKSLEAFSMAFEPSDDGVHLHMGWDKVRVAVPFTK